MTTHEFMGGKVRLYQRENSHVWQCSTYMAGKRWRMSTRERSLAQAKDFAEDWYLELCGKASSGDLKLEKSFKQAAEQFKYEYEVITEGERNPLYVRDHYQRLENHLLPFFGKTPLSKVTAGMVQEYRVYRTKTSEKPPSRSTMHHEIVTIRQVLKTAMRHGWLQHMPDLSMPYRSAGKITHRAWFSPEDYKRLYEATRTRAREAQGKSQQWACEQLHDYVLFMANTGLRPDEANRLECRDVEIEEDDSTGDTILVVEVMNNCLAEVCNTQTFGFKKSRLSFKMSLSSSRSATICFNRPFSFDRAFNSES